MIIIDLLMARECSSFLFKLLIFFFPHGLAFFSIKLIKSSTENDQNKKVSYPTYISNNMVSKTIDSHPPSIFFFLLCALFNS